MCTTLSSLDNLRPLARRVLVVEDHPETLRALIRLLTLDGFEVLPAATVAQAIDQLTLQPDIVVTDLMLPDGTGLEVLRRARSREESIVVAIYTGVDDERIREIATTGPDAIFHKPASVDELRNWLKDPKAMSRTQPPAVF